MSKRSRQPLISRIPGGRLALHMASSLVTWVRSAPGSSFCGGALAGLLAVTFCHQMFARFGGGLMMSGGAATAVAVGLVTAAIVVRATGRARRPSFVAALIPAVWVFAIGWLADRLDLVYRSFDLDSLASPAGQFEAS